MQISTLLNLFLNPYMFIDKFLCFVRSRILSNKITDGKGKIKVKNRNFKVKIVLGKNANFKVNGTLTFNNHLNGDENTTIIVKDNGSLTIDGDFIIGNGVKIFIDKGASLYLGGKAVESASGITSNTKIMVRNKINVGKDFICAWDSFITDCDWHSIKGYPVQADVNIGNKVWIANNTNILKGTTINDGCIVASMSKLGNKSFPPNSLIAGTPGKVIKEKVVWSRDMQNV